MLDLTSTNETSALWAGSGRWWFNQAGFVFSRPTPPRFTFYERSHDATGVLHLYETEPGRVASPWRASFGGADTTGLEVTERLWAEAIEFGKHAGWKSVEVTLAPDIYHAHIELERQYLLSVGFKQFGQEINYAVPLHMWSPSFVKMEQRKLSKAQQAGYTFAILEPENWDVERLYSLLSANRLAKGYALSLTQEGLTEMLAASPERHLVAVVKLGDDWAAIGICVRVATEVLYLFYPADDYAHRSYSPMVVLYDGLIQWAKLNGITLLDQGTASLNGVLNQGLATFKERVGGYASVKTSLIFQY